MAPEVAACSSSEGKVPYGIQVDTWSYGVLICEMLCGKPPLPEDIDWRRDGDRVVEFLGEEDKKRKKSEGEEREEGDDGKAAWPRYEIERLLGDRFPKAAESLVSILRIDAEERPSFADINNIAALPWFGDTAAEWNDVHRKTPPTFCKKLLCEFAGGDDGGEKGLTEEEQALFDF